MKACNGLRAKYDAAATTKDNCEHWKNADSLSADAGLLPMVRRRLRDRSRYEFANNTYCAGMLKTLAFDVIGTGPKLSFQTGDKALDSELEWNWYEWTRATNWPEKLRLIRLARARDGESWGRFVFNPNVNHNVKLDLLLYEAEQVSGDEDTDGILLDAFGNATAYKLLREHPGHSLTSDYEIVPARQMIHAANLERAGQHRGVPEITPALPLFAQLRRYTLAVIAAAETAADIAGVVKSQVVGEPDAMAAMDVLEIERRSLLTLPKGWDLTQLKSEQPTTTYEMFKRGILSEIARCLNMPYNIAAGDSSSFNYSSARLDFRNWQKTRGVDRSQIEWRELDSTLDAWWQEARLIGLVPNIPTPRHTWSWDGDLHIDPAKESAAQAQRLASMTTTLADEYAKEGKDWEQALQQIAREREVMEELGLTIQPTEPQEPTEEDDETNIRRAG